MIGLKLALVIFAFLFFTQAALAQEDEEEPVREEEPVKAGPEKIPEFKRSIRACFKLPNAIANQAFKKVFNGISNLEVGFTQPISKNFYVGANIQHGYYDINRYSFAEVSNGKMMTAFAFGEVGVQKYWSPRWYWTFNVRAGFGNVWIKTENCGPEPKTKSMLYTEEQFGIYLWANERMSYGMLVSHQLLHFAFHPGYICRTSFGGLFPEDWAGPSHSFTIGFGFTCLLGKEFKE